MKTHLIPVNDSESLTDCQKVLKENIERNSEGNFQISRDLILNYLPQKVVDSFLDFLCDLTSEEIAHVLEEIKNGSLTVICNDED